MKRLYFSTIAALALIFSVWIAVPAIITGCSTSAQRTTFNTLYTSGHAVDTAYKGYLDLVVHKQLPTNDVVRISKLYTDFQEAYSAALVLSAFNTNAPPTPEVKNAESQLLLNISAVKKGLK